MPVLTSLGIAAIIGAIVAAGGLVTSSVISSHDLEEARIEGRELSDIKRKDDLNFQKSQDRLNKLNLAQRKREAKMQERTSRKQLKQREKEFASTERTEFFNKQMGMLNSSEVMRNNFANNFRRGA